MASTKKVQELIKKREEVLQGGGEKAIQKQVAMGKMTARERIVKLLDDDSFNEYDLFVEHEARDFGMDRKVLHGDGVITGTGTIGGRPVCIFAQDFTVAGGSLGSMHARKITKIMDHAMKLGVPIIGINDSGGARIQEGVNSLAGYGEIFYRNTLASGVIPQISVILGPCAGGAVYSPALTDFVFVVDNISKMFITGPEVIKTTIGEEISMEDLGGARVHSEITGNAHFFAESEQQCFEQIKELITYIPWNNQKKADPFPKKAPRTRTFNIDSVIPTDPKQPYDVRDVIRAISDDSEFFEIQELFAANIVIGFGRLKGETIGFVANQPLVLAGVLDVDSSDKAARFIRYCDSFNIPLITLVDLPGYLPGVDQEHGGIIRHGAKLLYAYCEATVPRIQVITRKAYGGAYVVMNSKSIGADLAFAWPTAELAVMGPQGAVEIVYRRELQQAADPTSRRAELVQEYTDKYATPYAAAERGYIDDVMLAAFVLDNIVNTGNPEVVKKHWPGDDDVLQVIGTDPALTANLLKLANSALFGVGRQIGTPHQALVLLGNRTVLNLAFATGMGRVLTGPLAAYRLGSRDLWRHSLAVGLGAAVDSTPARRELGLQARPVREAVAVDATEEIMNLMLDTGTAVGGFQAPWSVQGRLSAQGESKRRFDLEFTFTVRDDDGEQEVGMRLKGVADFAKTPFPIAGTQPLSGWTLTWRDPEDPAAKEMKGVETVEALRTLIKDL